MKSFAFVVSGCVAWYMAWRAEAKRRALFESAERLMEMRRQEEAANPLRLMGNNNYHFSSSQFTNGTTLTKEVDNG